MALELVQPGIQPLGQFDGKDDIYLTVKGGEVATIIATPITPAVDKGAADADDGYVMNTRPVVTTVLAQGSRPLFLVDDGIYGYGTMFGSVIGGIAGQIAYGLGQPAGTQLGPHTAAGSGKLTLWDKPGTYAVTLDAVDTTASTGLLPTNPTLTIGDALYATAVGLLTPNDGVAFEAAQVGYFLNFEPWKGGSLVTTPVTLVGGTPSNSFYRALFHFSPPSQMLT
jgi:hypothetical protein